MRAEISPWKEQRRSLARVDALEGLVLVDDLHAMLVLLRRRLVTDRSKVPVHRLARRSGPII